MKALTPDSLTQTARSLRLRRSAVPTFRPQPRDPPDGRFEYQSPQRHQLFQASPPMSRLATRSRRNRFVILRTAGSPPVALHPASRRRSYLQFLGLRPAQARTCTVQTKRPHGTHSWPGLTRPSATRGTLRLWAADGRVRPGHDLRGPGHDGEQSNVERHHRIGAARRHPNVIPATAADRTNRAPPRR
jgi:hypothetical protein